MGRRVRRSGLLAAACLIAAALLVSAGCSGGLLDWVKERASVVQGLTLSGVFLDSVTGAPAPGCTLQLDTYTATSASDGTFSIHAAGPVSGAYSVYGPNYQFSYVTPVSLSGDTQVSIFMAPVNSSGYPKHTLTGRIYAAGGTEIATSTNVMFTILNSSTGQSQVNTTYGSTGYSIQTPTWGSDCLVLACVQTAPTTFTVIAKADLSGATPTLTLSRDTAPGTTVNVTGAVNNFADLVLSTPYGLLDYGRGGYYILSSVPYAALVTNPYGYKGMWFQVNSNVGAFQKVLVSYSDFAPIDASVTLPALNGALGPNSAPLPSSISYSGGTLAIAPVGGAKIYQFMLSGGGSSGMIMSNTASVSLPTWIRNLLSGKSITVSVTPMDWNITTSDIATFVQGLNAMGALSGLQMGQSQVTPPGSNSSPPLAF